MRVAFKTFIGLIYTNPLVFPQEIAPYLYNYVPFLIHLLFFFVDMVNDAVIPMAAVGIQYFAGPVVTILASKTSRKYTPTYRYLTILWIGILSKPEFFSRL